MPVSRAVREPVVVRAQTPEQPVQSVFQPTMPQKQTAADPPVYLPLTLKEAIESALSDSSVIRVLNGGVNLASITATDTLIAAQRIELEQGRFQPRLSANYDASHIDQPPNAFFGPGIAANTRRDATSASARVTQPLKTGGSLSLGLEPPLAYLFFPNGVDPGNRRDSLRRKSCDKFSNNIYALRERSQRARACKLIFKNNVNQREQ